MRRVPVPNRKKFADFLRRGAAMERMRPLGFAQGPGAQCAATTLHGIPRKGAY